MISLPEGFISTRYPGYFWHFNEKKLYSIKVTGELKPLKFSNGGWFNGVKIVPGYSVSHRGIRHKYTLDYLATLKPSKLNETIPLWNDI